MKIFASALVFAALAAPTLAQSAPAEKVPYVCFYNAAGKFTFAKPAEPGTPANGNFVTTGRGGDQAWAYGVRSVDGTDCPKRVRS